MKINFKKISALFLACGVVAGVFSGCETYNITSGYTQPATETISVKNEVDEEELKEAFSLKLEELKDTYSIFERNQSGNMGNPETAWFSPKGVMSGCVMDFDLDGQDEMAVFYTDIADAYQLNYNMFLSIYEYYEGNVNIADDMLLDSYIDTEYIPEPKGFLWRPALWSEESVIISTQVVNGKNYIICEHSSESSAFADGRSYNYWLLGYDEERLRYEASYTQTEGGSSGFEYTGYKFENGLESEDPLYYAMGFEDALYDDYNKALTSYFKDYGLKVRSDNEPYKSNGSIFVSEGRTEILRFTNKCKQNTINYSYDFTATLTPATEYEP